MTTLAGTVEMPEAAMHEDDCAMARKGEVGLSGEILVVKTVSVAKGVDETAHNEFGAGVCGPNFAHKLRTAFWIDGVQPALLR